MPINSREYQRHQKMKGQITMVAFLFILILIVLFIAVLPFLQNQIEATTKEVGQDNLISTMLQLFPLLLFIVILSSLWVYSHPSQEGV